MKTIQLSMRLGVLLLIGCGAGVPAGQEETVNAVVPVKVGLVSAGPLYKTAEFVATSSFLRKSELRSTIAGYVTGLSVNPGDEVFLGKTLFQIKTKEASILGNRLFPNDTTLKFSGLIPVRSSGNGIVTGLHHQNGDFVQEGDAMVTTADAGSLVFTCSVPYEQDGLIKLGMSCDILLLEQKIPGKVIKKLAIMDPASQTESFVVRPEKHKLIPENLAARISIKQMVDTKTLFVPPAAVLSNEEQTAFWVMQVKGHYAYKKLVQVGSQLGGLIPVKGSLYPGDTVLVSGNYGLADTAQIRQ